MYTRSSCSVAAEKLCSFTELSWASSPGWLGALPDTHPVIEDMQKKCSALGVISPIWPLTSHMCTACKDGHCETHAASFVEKNSQSSGWFAPKRSSTQAPCVFWSNIISYSSTQRSSRWTTFIPFPDGWTLLPNCTPFLLSCVWHHWTTQWQFTRLGRCTMGGAKKTHLSLKEAYANGSQIPETKGALHCLPKLPKFEATPRAVWPLPERNSEEDGRNETSADWAEENIVWAGRYGWWWPRGHWAANIKCHKVSIVASYLDLHRYLIKFEFVNFTTL